MECGSPTISNTANTKQSKALSFHEGNCNRLRLRLTGSSGRGQVMYRLKNEWDGRDKLRGRVPEDLIGDARPQTFLPSKLQTGRYCSSASKRQGASEENRLRFAMSI